MAISKVLELARKYGKSEAEVAAYSDNTGHETANDLALWEGAGTEIAGLTDAPTAPGRPTGVATDLSVALTWTAATRASTYQVRTIFMNGEPDVDGAYASGTTATVVTPKAGTYQFKVRGKNADGVEGPWSQASTSVLTTEPDPEGRKAPAAKKTAAKKKEK